jgi:hypothetical protein
MALQSGGTLLGLTITMKTTCVPLSERKRYKFILKDAAGGRIILGTTEYLGFNKLIIEEQLGC